VTRIIRYALAAVAVLACAWFVVGLRQAHEIDAATNLLNNGGTERSAAVQQHARSLLDSAAFINPGVDVTLLRAQLAENEGAWANAARVLYQAASAEPDNLSVWIAYLRLWLMHPAFGHRKLLYSRLHQLDPVDVYAQ
jgi:hypothetical protein